MYAKHIHGSNDSVALACARDSKCKAFRYSANNSFGYLCNDSDAKSGHDDWELCTINPG